MSLPAQPNNTDDKVAKKTNKKPAATVAPVTTTAPAAPHEPRSYLAMMAMAVFLLPTGLARAYRGDKSGWTRFWTYIAANVIMVIPILGQVIGGLMVLVLAVFGVVDVFKLRKTTTDAFGKPLVASEFDKKWAHGFYIYFLVIFIMISVILTIGVILLSYALQQYQMNGGDFMQQMDASYPSERYIEPDSF